MRHLFSTKRGRGHFRNRRRHACGQYRGAYAYFTTTAPGQAAAPSAPPRPWSSTRRGITYSNAGTDNALMPGTSATVSFTVDNPSSANQQLGTISVSSITTDAGHAACDTATNPTWFSTTTDVVNHDYAPGNGQAVSGTITVTFNDLAVSQDVCKGAPLTFHYGRLSTSA